MDVDPQIVSIILNYLFASATVGLIFGIRKILSILGRIGRILSEVDLSYSNDGKLDAAEIGRIFDDIRALITSPEVNFLKTLLLKK